MKELAAPPDAERVADAAEVLRAWIINQGLQVSLAPGSFGGGENEIIVWSILLTDITRHIAAALHKSEGLDPKETITKIKAHFNLELDEPTAEAKGDFIV